MKDNKKIKPDTDKEIATKDSSVKDASNTNSTDKELGIFNTENENNNNEEESAEATEKTEISKNGKKKIVKLVKRGQVFIQATYNNTIVSLTDQNGNILAWSSAGKCGFKGAKKSTPYAAGVVVKDVATKIVKDRGLREVNVFVKGVGTGREGAVRALQANGLTVLAIKDVTPMPHNGCRARKVRRV